MTFKERAVSFLRPFYNPVKSYQKAKTKESNPRARKYFSAFVSTCWLLALVAVSAFLIFTVAGAPAGLAGLGTAGAGIATAIAQTPLWASITGLVGAGTLFLGVVFNSLRSAVGKGEGERFEASEDSSHQSEDSEARSSLLDKKRHTKHKKHVHDERVPTPEERMTYVAMCEALEEFPKASESEEEKRTPIILTDANHVTLFRKIAREIDHSNSNLNEEQKSLIRNKLGLYTCQTS